MPLKRSALVASPVMPDFTQAKAPAARFLRWLAGLGLVGVIAYAAGDLIVLRPDLLQTLAAPLGLLALVIVWALPKGGRPPERAIRFCFFALIASLLLWPNYLALSLPGLPWITMQRLFGIPLFFLLLISLSISATFRHELAETLAVSPWLGRLFIMLNVIQAISVFVSKLPSASLQKLILFQIYGTCLFLVGCHVARRDRMVRQWILVFTLSLVPICLIAIQEVRLQQVLWVGHIPSFLAVEDPVVAAMLTPGHRAASNMYRVQSTFPSALALAEYLAYAMPFVLHFVVSARSPWTRLAAAASVPVLFFVVKNTDSRLGIVGFMFSFLGFFLLWGVRRWARHRTSLMGPTVTLAFPLLLAMTITASFTVNRVRHMVWGTGAQQASTDSRKEQLSNGIPLILKRPTGYGLTRAASTLGFYSPGGVLTIDSWWLAVALELGPFGFIIYAAIFCIGIYVSLRGAMSAETEEEQLFAPLSVSLMNFAIIKSVLAQEGNHPMIFMMLGLIVGLAWRQRQRRMGMP